MFIHLSLEEHLGCYYFLAIMNHTTVNICVQAFVRTFDLVSLGYIMRNGISGSCGNFVVNLLSTC